MAKKPEPPKPTTWKIYKIASKGVRDDRAASFDHLVCDREQVWRNGKAESPSGLEVDRQLELGWQLNG
jgi:hypothetical protein